MEHNCPVGCGEQNMVKLAPNIYLLEYLRNNDLDNSENKELKEKALRYMQVKETLIIIGCLGCFFSNLLKIFLTLRWEFIKENKKVWKKSMHETKLSIKKEEDSRKNDNDKKERKHALDQESDKK